MPTEQAVLIQDEYFVKHEGVSSTPANQRVVEFYVSSGAPIFRAKPIQSSSSDQPMSNEKLDKIEERLGKVETDVAVIKERLSHMPTTAQLWKALAWAGGVTIAAILGGGWWAIQQYLSPIMQKISGH